MNEHEQQIAIARIVFQEVSPPQGLLDFHPGRVHIVSLLDKGGRMGTLWEDGHTYEGGFAIPDYLNDLNAMAEAEKVLTGTPLHNYGMFLAEVVWDETYTSRDYQINFDEATDLISANAAQRAEAFLRCLNIWAE